MDALIIKVNRILGRDVKWQTLESTIKDLVDVIEQLQEENGFMAEKHAEKDMAIRELVQIVSEQKEKIDQLETVKRIYSNSIDLLLEEVERYKLQETQILEQNKKFCLQIKELKRNSRTIRFFEMAEENLRMAQEVERLKRG